MADIEHRSALKPGYKLLWYRIDRILGQGGFGITYLAFDLNLSNTVAIKEYLPTDLSVRDTASSVHPISQQHSDRYRWGLERFIAEARTLARFNHPNVVRVLSVFEQNNTAYMVMEYEEGQSLEAMLKSRRTLPEDEIRGFLVPVLDGLRLVHDAGFIHRDIKPGNIFMRRDGTPVLLDFGSARQAMGSQTRTLTSVVSPGYAPLEQYFSKSDKQGPWTDIYGLAATVYHAVAGRPPLDAIGRSEGLLRGDSDPLASAEEIGRGRYSPGFLRAIDAGLRFMERDRPQSIAQWLAYFSGAEAGAAAPPPIRPVPDDDRTNFELPIAMRAEGEREPVSTAARPPARSSRLPWKALSLAGAGAVLLAGVWIYREPLLNWVDPGRAERRLEAQHLLALTQQLREQEQSAQAQRKLIEQQLEKRRQAEAAAHRQQIEKQRKLAAEQVTEEARKLAAKQAAAKQAATEKQAQARQAQIAGLLRQAQSEMGQGRLSGSGQGNALARYRAVLALDASNDAARKGIAAVVSAYVAEAEKEARAGRVTEAQAALAQAAAIDPKAGGIARARARIDAAKARSARAGKVRKLLAQAQQAMDAGRIYAPQGNNAIELYKQVKSLEPGNVAVKRAYIDIVNQLMAMANKSSYAGDYKAAYHYLDIAAELFPDAEEIKNARNFVDLRKLSREQAAARKRKLKQEEQRIEAEKKAALNGD